MLRRTFCILLASAAVAGAAQAQDVKTLNFGIISTESSSNLKSAWQPLIEDLSKAVGVPVKPFFASDYAGIIEGMRFNKVQLAWYGNKSAMEAVDRAQGEVFASVIDKDGNPGYWSVLLVNKASPYNSVEDIIKNGKNLSFGTGDPNSTSGNLVPGYYLWAANKVDPKTLFKNVRVANHETNLLSVINKQVDVAVANTEALERYRIATGKDAAESVRVLWKSPLIPADPIVWRSDLPADMKTRLRDFFVNYGKGKDAAREQEVLKDLTYKGFRASDNQQLIPIRQLEYAKEKARVQADANMSEADRGKRVAELDGKLAALQKQAAQ
ncbi:phosphonate ABC transporter substrate-binding protein [Bordetella pseudohinzii]|uniref:Phosphate-import protein phnD n=1 Tax=Bordetella pseudohinzii TaxID=1331258 RepID=A0A0J6C1P0_9BORD|nr:phosphonate ABC transporter substrate-binding protein [Bordetella pseudohinzii]ANY16936.1 phosphonate ABC transporter substrate-binding protein [Bordetella pseudohinzii]KMM24686.1 alkylphosphonate ABC transporter substrate-binding protein [Bordetella pseudohinzii]KXA75849.1 phosphonate ABC transporter substrate-binding protein [Bordetella pseudohinzii]KXA77509.1 phosphonate ABC transporter substrate-binding protein [Bordetella pseudohinzii]CUJ07701.1 Phosphate-import protein phnD precursor 